MSRRETIAGIALTGYWLVTVLAHLQVSLWLVRRRQADWLGSFRYADFLPWLFALAALGILIWQLVRAIRAEQRLATAIAWLLWFALAWAFDRWLTYSLAEMLHYPQYGLLAYLLALSVDPDKRRFAFGPVLLAVVLLGIADEALQYVWITIDYSNYLDFNDFSLNLLAAFAGLLLYYGFPRNQLARPSGRDLRYGLTGFFALGLVLLSLSAAIQAADPTPPLVLIERAPSYGQWIAGPRHGGYHVLPPTEGSILIAALGALAGAAPIALRTRGRNLQHRAFS